MTLEEWRKSEAHSLLHDKRMKHHGVKERSSSTFVTGGVKLGAGVRMQGDSGTNVSEISGGKIGRVSYVWEFDHDFESF